MKKEAILFLILFTSIISNIVFADLTPDNIYTSDSVKIQSNISSFFIVPNSISDITATILFFPKNEYRQKVDKLRTTPLAIVGQNEIIFNWKNPAQEKITYGIESTISTLNEFKQVKKKIQYPIREISAEAAQFLESTAHINSNDLQIKKIAKELAKGEDDLFVLVSKIGAWVQKNVNYSLTTMTAEVSQPASWVLKNKVGVCDELTSLFAAMLRSLGIPTKFASGLAYSNSPLTKEKWGAHGWAEVYFPSVGWIPFDPTFGEFGWLDSGHIKMKESADSVHPASKLEWTGTNANLEIEPLQFKTDVVSIGQKISPLIKIDSTVLKPKIGFDSWNVIEVEVENLKEYYVTAEIKLAKAKELETKDPASKHLILRPFEKQKIFWKVHIKPELESKFAYIVPVRVYTLRNETASSQIISTATAPKYSFEELSEFVEAKNTAQIDTGKEIINLVCKPSKEQYLQEEIGKISCDLINLGSTKISQLTICAQKNCRYESILPNEKISLEYYLENKNIGVKEFFVTAQKDSLFKKTTIKYTVSDLPQLKIENITIANEIEFDEKKRMRFTLSKKSWAAAQKAIVRIEGARRVQQVNFDYIDSDIPFIFVIEGKNLDAGNNTIKITAQYFDENNKEHTIKKTANINLVNINARQMTRMLFRNIGEFLAKII